MPLDILVGAQWGDEGKGRVVDLLAADADWVARFNGGDNAGHTVTVGRQTFKLHLVPSGIVHPHPRGVIGNGVVINPVSLMQEVQMLKETGVDTRPARLKISFAAHLITPAHRALDAAQERARGQLQIGTTGRGIGPAYTDRAARRGLRLLDTLDEITLKERLHQSLLESNRMLMAWGSEPLDVEAATADYLPAALALRPYLTDTGLLLHQALKAGEKVLAEGAQGTLLDLDLGTYPFVTSSSTTAAGVLPGLGLGMLSPGRVVGVTKAFQTRVGSGPFPTEELDEIMTARLRGTGANPWDEFGTTTGRPRRVGWLDGVLLRYAVRVNGLTELVLTKLDVLSGLPVIRICTAYQDADRRLDELPLGPANLAPFAPIYEELPGWSGDISHIRHWQDLPDNAQAYVRRVEEISGAPVSLISVGPEREQIIARSAA
ncbi:MAG TPA: adenylosuccinate synthase [Anaerolineaceae bacterium]|nr:adenylosuccinate synthase [Anaerolineaceae bacterium]